MHEIYAHRAVLASASPYFLDMFANDADTGALAQDAPPKMYKLPRRLLSGIYDVDAFEQLIDYIYTSRLELKPEHVKAVYAVANRLKMSECSIACGQFMTTQDYTKGAINETALCKSLEALPKVKVRINELAFLQRLGTMPMALN